MDIRYLSVKDTVPASGYWDQTFIHDLLYELPETDRKVFIIPGAYQYDVIDKINLELAKFPKVLVFVTSDEECKFNVEALSHPDMIVYSQYGNKGLSFPIGYPPYTRDIIKSLGLRNRDISFSFSGQVTHQRREMMIKIAENIGGGLLNKTDGFAKGLPQEVYLETMLRSKAVLCPPGPFSQDSFRLYEALEAGCIPVVDDVSPMTPANYRYLANMFHDAPFPIFSDYGEFPTLLNSATNGSIPNRYVYTWWINLKYRLRTVLKKNLGVPLDDTVVVIPVSPIPSHPSTEILDETIRSIRHHTNATILVTIDGVREEQKDMEENYLKFIDNFLWKCNFEYKDVLPVLFPKHFHQAGMMKYVISEVKCPFIMYVEQDTPLTEDPIEWDKIKEKIRSGDSNMVRFHFEAFIPEEHKYLMIGEPENGFQKTKQWSQRPHIASTEFYKRVMKLFSDNADCFIEDFLHGKLQSGDWEGWRVHIYHPEGNIKRSYHTDGRAGGKKFDDTQIW